MPSLSRDGTEGVGDSGMIVDIDKNVAHQQKHQVDEDEDERTIEQGLDQPGEDDQAMNLVGDKTGNVGVGGCGADAGQQYVLFIFFHSFLS